MPSKKIVKVSFVTSGTEKMKKKKGRGFSVFAHKLKFVEYLRLVEYFTK